MVWFDFGNRHAGSEQVVSYSTLMVHLELGKPNAGLLAVAGDLAERFHAHVIGIAACQPMQFEYGTGYVSADYFERDMADLRKDSQVAETEFRSALQSRAGSLRRAMARPHVRGLSLLQRRSRKSVRLSALYRIHA
jgi:hypothetical protein